jgi:hypothetical protein
MEAKMKNYKFNYRILPILLILITGMQKMSICMEPIAIVRNSPSRESISPGYPDYTEHKTATKRKKTRLLLKPSAIGHTLELPIQNPTSDKDRAANVIELAQLVIENLPIGSKYFDKGIVINPYTIEGINENKYARSNRRIKNSKLSLDKDLAIAILESDLMTEAMMQDPEIELFILNSIISE